MNDYELTKYAEECAADIVADIKVNHLSEGEELEDYRDEMTDQVHEHADASEHVIYYSKAHNICHNCNIDAGEAFLEDTGNPEPCTYNGLAVVIAYGELSSRIEIALTEIIAESE